jgi:hypothetical protein
VNGFFATLAREAIVGGDGESIENFILARFCVCDSAAGRTRVCHVSSCDGLIIIQ